MATLEELVVSLVAETSGLRAELANAAKATQDATSTMNDAVEEFSKSSSDHMGFFQTATATAAGFLASEFAEYAVEKAKEALKLLVEQLKLGVDAAEKQETAFTRLANSLAISGHYSSEAQKGLEDFSHEMEKTTGVQDDVIAKNLALLSSLTKLDSEGLQKAQKAALDMSAAMGIDLNTATLLVSKGIEGNVSAFTRYGVSIQEGSTKAEQFTNVVNALEKSFGGAAEGSMKTFQGATLGLTNAFHNMSEAVGNTIVQNPVVIAMMQQLAEVFEELEKYVQDNSDLIREDLAKGFIFVADAIGVMAQIGDSVFRSLYASIEGLKLGLDAIVGSVNWLGDKLGIVKDEDPFSSLKKTAEALDKTINEETALGKLATTMADVGYAGEQAFAKIGAAAKTTKPTIDEQGKALEELGGKEKQILLAFAQGLADEAQALDSSYNYENSKRQLALETELAQLKEHNKNKFDLQNDDFKTQQKNLAAHYADEQASLVKARQHDLISDTQFDAASLALSRKHDLEEKKLEQDMTKFKEAEQAARNQGYMTFLDGISALTQSSNKELQDIGKAAAITKATIDAYLAIQNALANVPFPANIAASVGIGVLAFANVAKIAGIGFNEGGTLVGGGANMDTVPASLTKGETVVSRDLTDKLTAFLNNQGDQSSFGGNATIEISLKDHLVEFIEAKILERQRLKISLLT